MTTQTEQSIYTVDTEFKTSVVNIFAQREFGEVHGVMKLLRRDGNEYSGIELDSIIAHLSKLPYSQVFQIFDSVKSWVRPYAESATKGPSGDESNDSKNE